MTEYNSLVPHMTINGNAAKAAIDFYKKAFGADELGAVRAVRADRRVVGLLGFPGDYAVLDVDLPRARSRAVDAVRRTDDLVVRPAVAVEVIG